MKTKKITLVFVAFMMAMNIFAYHHDFEVNGICYNINSDNSSVTVVNNNSKDTTGIVYAKYAGTLSFLPL